MAHDGRVIFKVSEGTCIIDTLKATKKGAPSGSCAVRLFLWQDFGPVAVRFFTKILIKHLRCVYMHTWCNITLT